MTTPINSEGLDALVEVRAYVEERAEDAYSDREEKLLAKIDAALKASLPTPVIEEKPEVAIWNCYDKAEAAIDDEGLHQGVFIQLLRQKLDLSDALLDELEEEGNLAVVADAILAEVRPNVS